MDAPMVQVSPSDAMRFRQELIASFSVEDICSMEDKTPIATPSGDANERDAPINPSSWEEIASLQYQE